MTEPFYYGKVTIRESTAEERKIPIRSHPKVQHFPKYILVDPDKNQGKGGYFFVFGIPQGGKSKAEAVFWAERLASKNGFKFVRPEGWERVVGALSRRALPAEGQ